MVDVTFFLEKRNLGKNKASTNGQTGVLKKGRQMYKIYINETPLYLTTPAKVEKLGTVDEKKLALHYVGKKKFLLNVIDQLEKSRRFEHIVVFAENLEKLWADFQSAFKLIGAAGGVVFNNEGQVLMIFRRGSWDLPKGKIDPGESPAEAAVREVQEETGLVQLDLGPHLADTWHTYEQDAKRILKTTHWFRMKTSEKTLTPQQEEDIEQAVWRDLNAFLKKPEKVYGSILDVLTKAGA